MWRSIISPWLRDINEYSVLWPSVQLYRQNDKMWLLVIFNLKICAGHFVDLNHFIWQTLNKLLMVPLEAVFSSPPKQHKESSTGTDGVKCHSTTQKGSVSPVKWDDISFQSKAATIGLSSANRQCKEVFSEYLAEGPQTERKPGVSSRYSASLIRNERGVKQNQNSSLQNEHGLSWMHWRQGPGCPQRKGFAGSVDNLHRKTG